MDDTPIPQVVVPVPQEKPESVPEVQPSEEQTPYEPKECDDDDLSEIEKNLCEYVESKKVVKQ